MGDSGPPFRQTRIPADLAEEIVRLLEDNPCLGYRTLSDFVRAATIERLRSAHAQVALRAIHATTELGADAVEALLLDSLPAEYRDVVERERDRRERQGRR